VPRKRRLHWPPRPAPQQCRRRAPHAWAAMGRGRVDPAPPAPINSDPKGRRRREKTAENGEGNRERETNSVEREGTETVETENRGNQQRDRERQTEKRTERVNRSGLVSLRRGEEEPLLSSGFSVIATAAPPRTVASTTVSSAIRDHRLR